MRAVVLHEHGGPENLVYEENFPDPKIGAGDVIINVKATSLNYHDVFTRRGMPGIKLDLPVICGLDVAGEIAEIGPEVEGWSVGDRVLIDPLNRVEGGLMGETVNGGLAELCLARAHQLVPIPDGVSFEQAAALPVAYGTAHRMMFTNGNIKKGERCLVLGASGGVGSCCVLLAKLAGAEVVAATSSDEKGAQLRAMGADHIIDYTTQAFEKEVWKLYEKPHRRTYDGGVNMVVNFTGGDTWVPSFKCLQRGGRLMTCGATAGFDPKTDIRYIWTFELQILGSNSWAREDLEALLGYIDKGEMTVPIDKVFPLPEAREALRLIEDREVIGKVIVAP